jgi:predicted nucleic acid-binding protein
LRLVVADTSPINYLILIGHIEILPALFENVMLPPMVRDWVARALGSLMHGQCMDAQARRGFRRVLAHGRSGQRSG